MKALKNRVLTFFLAVIMVIGVLPTAVFGEMADANPEWGILKNCSVSLNKEGNFLKNDTSVQVNVTLDESLEKVYMTVFSYPGNVSFDVDSSANKRLYGGYVTNGQELQCSFNANELPLKKGWKVIACLNVPVGNDNYRSVISKAIEVVDESGAGAPNYLWPDVSILETELAEGGTSAHLKLTGDERLFQNKKIDIHYCVYQYPKEEKFDFESENMVSLYSAKADGAFDNKEVPFSEPLRAGYRVRAVTYWTQDYDSFVPKSNDYEFGQPDDSVLISAKTIVPSVSIASNSVKAGASTVKIDVSGEVPAGSLLIIQSYPKNETYQFGTNGIFVANKIHLSAGQGQIISVTNKNNVTIDKKLIAVILSNGNVIAQSAPVEIVSADTLQPFVLEFVGDVCEGDKVITLNVNYDDAITEARLLLHEDDSSSSSVNLEHQILNLPLQKGQGIQIAVPAQKELKAGKKLAASIYYCKPGTADDYQYYTTKQIVVQPKRAVAGISISNAEFTKDSSSATLQISGCDEYLGGQLIICQYPADQGVFDPDSSTTKRLYQGVFNQQGTLLCQFNQNTLLVSGNKVIAYLYKYDSKTDSVKMKYSLPALVSAQGTDTIATKIEITTPVIRVDDNSIWVINNFDERSYNGRLIVYEYEGNEFNPSASSNIILYSEAVSASDKGKKIVFDSNKLPLKYGFKLKAALLLTEKSGSSNAKFEYSAPVTVQGTPIMITPTVTINEKKITEGDTKMKVSVNYDKNVKNAEYTVYQYEGDTLDKSAATTKILNSGTASKWDRFHVNFEAKYRPLKPGAKIVTVLRITTSENNITEYSSNVITVEARPNWVTPIITLDAASVKASEKKVPVTIRYHEGYHTLDEFYCNVTLYQYPAYVENFDHEEQYAEPIGSINGTVQKPILGEGISVPLTKPLKKGYKLIAKLRLPHVEWEDEEVDYLSGSANIIDENAREDRPMVLLYQLGEDSARGSRIRKILKDLNIEVKTIEKAQINETIGYLAELEDYPSTNQPYSGGGYDTEFIIMSALSETKLDAFLYAMMEQNLRINHKAAVTQTNRDWTFRQLVGDIESEHDVFTALLELDKLVKEAEKLNGSNYEEKKWESFQQQLKNAVTIVSSVEPSLLDLENATLKLKEAMMSLTGQTELSGRVLLAFQKTGDTYQVTASVIGAPPNVTYTYLWSNGATTDSIKGVTANELIKLSVTVAGTGKFWGPLPKAQLKEPKQIEKSSLSSDNNKIVLHWKKAQEIENVPPVLEYIADVFCGDSFIKTVRTSGDATELSIDGLANDTNYSFRLYAANVVGRSDIVTLNGKLTNSSSGSSSSSGGSKGGSRGSSSTSGISDKPSVNMKSDNEHNGVTATVKSEGNLDKSGNLLVSVPAKQITEALHEAAELARKNNLKENALVQLQVKTEPSLHAIKVKIPQEVQESLIHAEVKGLNIISGNISVAFDKESLKEIDKQAKGEVQLSVSKGASVVLSPQAKEILGDRPVYQFKLEQASTTHISDFGKGNVEIGIPYELAKGENSKNIFIAYIDEKGNPHKVEGSYYDTEKKMAKGKTGHFSLYGVGYQEKETGSITSFQDIKNHWAKENIAFITEKGILKGTSPDIFSPEAPMTRGMFVTALGRLSAVDTSKYQNKSFADVAKNSYYAAYIEWAKEEGIIKGVGNGKFAPEKSMTREEMVSIMNSYIKKKGNTLPISHEANHFADEDKIHVWAKDAVKVMQQAGIISGKTENKFVPQGVASRAEVSTLLRSFLQLTAD